MVDVVELSFRALGAVVVDQVESGFADTSAQDPVFVGKSALDFMIEGGLPVMLDIRNYVDALRGGA